MVEIAHVRDTGGRLTAVSAGRLSAANKPDLNRRRAPLNAVCCKLV